MVASLASEVGEAGAFPYRVAADKGRAYQTAVARPAIRISVVAADALVASGATVAFFAQADPVCFVANAWHCSSSVAVAD